MSWLKRKKTEEVAAVEVIAPPLPVKVEKIRDAREAMLVTGTGMEPLTPIDAVVQATLPYPNHRPTCVRQSRQNDVCNCGVS